jgi:ABC-type lipoprotein export system ATPase subunit
LDNLWEATDEKKSLFIQWQTRFDSYKEDLEAKSLTKQETEEMLETKLESITSMSEISKFYEQHSIRKEIEDILCKVIGTIYSETDMKYKFLKKYVKNQHEVTIWKLEKDIDGMEYLIPIKNTSGGNRDIIDILIRVLVIKQFPENQRILLCDEPMKDLSKDLREAFFGFLKILTKSFGIQFIMITHEDEYIGEVPWKIRFQKVNTRTICTVVEEKAVENNG